MSQASNASAPHARAGSDCDLAKIEKWKTDDRCMAFSSMDDCDETPTDFWTRSSTQSN